MANFPTIPTMDDILDMPLDAISFRGTNANRVVKDTYSQLKRLQNVSSYSMQNEFYTCPRKFMRSKLRADQESKETRETNVTFAFGHAVGAGVACYDETLDLRAAIWQAFLAWDVDLLEEETRGVRKTGKSFHEAVWALMLWKIFHAEQTDLSDYEVVKSEATLVVDTEDGHYYTSHIDELLRHRTTGHLRIKENKTTSLVNVDAAMYANTDQTLSYSVLVDMLGEQEYEVMYTIYSTANNEWLYFPFVKSASKKAEWLQDQLLRNAQQDQYAELKFFPKRGANCMQYNRRCSEFELCDTSAKFAFGKEFSELPRCTSREQLEAIEHIDYFTTLTEVVERQKQRQPG